MAHSAFQWVVVQDNFPVKITALEAWGKQLVIGTDKGHLLVYEVTEKVDDENRKIYNPQLVTTLRDFAKGEITQISIVEEDNLMIILADGLITVHQLPSLNLMATLTKYKGSHLYSISRSGGVLKIVIGFKRKMFVCVWSNTDFVQKKELSVPDTVRTCVWCGNSLCIGFKREYNLVDVESGAMTELFSTGRSNPLATSLPQNQILLGRDNISVFIGYDGKPTRKYGLSWSEPPVLSVYSFPYIISILPKTVEIQFVFTAIIQTIPIANASFIAVTSTNHIYISNKVKGGTIWRLNPISFSEQIDALVKRKQISQALILCENLERTHLHNRDELLRHLKLLNAYHQFNQGHYSNSMEIFHSLKIDPLQVISLFQNYLPEKIRGNYTFPMQMETPQGVSQKKALEALIMYLESKRKELKLSETIKKAKTVSNTFSYGTTTNTGDVDIGGTDQVEWNVTTALAQIIDTTLLKASIQADLPVNVTTLLTLPNYCHIKECEKHLAANRKYRKELIKLYESNDMHKQALEKLKEWGLSKDSSDMDGTRPSIDYMKRLGKQQQELILQYASWVLKESPSEGLQIFLANRIPTEKLAPSRVLTFFNDIEYPNQYIVQYLEYLIHQESDETQEYHNKLVINYFEMVLDLKKVASRTDPKIAKMTAGVEPGQLGVIRKKLLDFLETSKFYTPSAMFSRYNWEENNLHEEKAILLSKIGDHYEALREYVHKLKDFETAEKYCHQHYDPENEQGDRDVYLSLLKVYMSPSQTVSNEELQVAAFKLLNKHYKEIDLPKALETLPENMPLTYLESYFEKVMREMNKNRRNKQIISNIQKCETMKVKTELLKLRSKSAKVTDDTVCPICQKRFLGDTAFAYYPTGVIVHYYCYKNQPDKTVCPVTGTKFDDLNQ
eukprot:TRINITY_DN5996_c0_g1_i2.p1 TRINITY_DN5996_c0_g1~~TRINITY_DN5996_c0_g1_i2.p1  ORF type:complete len:900 (-),score=202.10 TRINITY_DN5996_c0_g1_i2:552-3251(-)